MVTDSQTDWLQGGKPSGTVIGLIVLNWLLFAAMAISSHGKCLFIPSSGLLLKWGAGTAALSLLDGQVFRLVTSAFVHAGLIHLVINSYVLYEFAPMVERLYGRWRFLYLYVMSAVGASLTTMLFQPSLISCGASGPIFGLLGAALAFFWSHSTHFPASQIKLYSKILVVLVLWGIVYGVLTQGSDNLAHVGGLIFGLACGWLCRLQALGDFQFRKTSASLILLGPLVACALYVFETARFSNRPDILADMHYQAALSMIGSGRFEESLSELQSAISLVGSDPSYYEQLALVHLSLHQPTLTISDASKALQLQSSNFEAHLTRASAYHKLGKYYEAIDDCNEILSTTKNRGIVYNARAWFYAATGNYKPALLDSNESIRLEPNVATYHDTRGVVFGLLGDPNSALKDLDKAISADRTDGGFFYHRAWIHGLLHQDELRASDKKMSEKLGYAAESWEPVP